jgi:lipopolysaccharide/colanic/teichoic acid biosynthesis glycosyltransferase
MKRLMDVVVTLLLLPIAGPVILVAGALVRWGSPGPAFYRSERIGRDGAPITVLKLRTMWVDADDAPHRQYVVAQLTADATRSADGDLHKLSDDSRVTPIGRHLRRTSLDELPQLFNVLGGQMSLVGPRPDVPYAVEHYEPWQRERFDVLPGMTGLWQVSGRAALSPQAMLSLDIDYVRDWSLWLDVKLLARTVGVVVRQVGAA